MENAAEHLYINSWFAGTTESMALWEIYGSQGRGVALQSTTERYRKSAQFELPPEQYLFGRVTYHDDVEIAPELLQDFTQTISLPGSGLWPKVLDLALHKRSCYRHENEWRAVIYQDLDRTFEVSSNHSMSPNSLIRSWSARALKNSPSMP